MCLNPFGIVDDQLPLECSSNKCGEQYCKQCVQAIRGSSDTYPFTCMSCKKSVIPRRNKLIDEHLIWKHFCKLYGSESFLAVTSRLKIAPCDAIVSDLHFRRVHLQSRVNTFKTKLKNVQSTELLDNQLIRDVQNMIEQLDTLIDTLQDTNRVMHERALTIEGCVTSYRKRLKHFDRLCEELSNGIRTLGMESQEMSTDTSDNHDPYRMKILSQLPSNQNVDTIDEILRDIAFRTQFLESHLSQLKLLLEGRSEEVTQWNDAIQKADKMLKTIDDTQRNLNYLFGNLRLIERCIDDYKKYLTDDQLDHIPCSKFIRLLETTRIRTEHLEIKTYFPKVIELMDKWQNMHGINDQFEPKVMELFKAIENDIEKAFSNRDYICSIPFKVGVIGNGSVGKTAIIRELGQLVDQYLSTVAVERSTFGYLQFDTSINKCPHSEKTIPITFVDIEGATDAHKIPFIGNYKELISKADCDVYCIVFEQMFDDDLIRDWQTYINDELGRKCLLIRNKADLLFLQIFKQRTNKDYTVNADNQYVRDSILKEVKNNALFTKKREHLSDEVYLMAADCDPRLKNASFATFDKYDLEKTIRCMAIEDTRAERIRKLGVFALVATINTCFRRGYIVSKMGYQVAAAVSSIVPVLDEIPAYMGREKIRQAFGIHDNAPITNFFKRRTDELEKHLTEHQLSIPKKEMKSGCFKYLSRKTKEQWTTNKGMKQIKYVRSKETNNNNIFSIIGRKLEPFIHGAAVTLGAVGKVSDDAIRIAGVATSGALRAVSIVGIVVGVALIPLCAAWAFYSSGNRMNQHLHVLCNDLSIILEHFVTLLCNNCLEKLPASEKCEGCRQEIQSSESSSSSDDE